MLSATSYVLQHKILLRQENPTYRHWAAAIRGFTMVLITASRQNNFVGGTCALSSALLVLYASLVGVYMPLDVEQMFPFLSRTVLKPLSLCHPVIFTRLLFRCSGVRPFM